MAIQPKGAVIWHVDWVGMTIPLPLTISTVIQKIVARQ